MTPLAGYVAIVPFWRVWLGQLGIVVGLAFTGRRFWETSLHAGAALYALLLLVFIAPFIGLVFASSLLYYAAATTVILGILDLGEIWGRSGVDSGTLAEQTGLS